MIPKEKPFRSVKYLDYIRSLDCCECQYPGYLNETQAHHIITGGMATKAGDDKTVPLCSPSARGCHLKADKSKANAEKYQEVARSLFQSWSVKNGTANKKS